MYVRRIPIKNMLRTSLLNDTRLCIQSLTYIVLAHMTHHYSVHLYKIYISQSWIVFSVHASIIAKDFVLKKESRGLFIN